MAIIMIPHPRLQACRAGCSPAGLRRGRGPLGKCSSCDVIPANLKVKVGGDEMETEGHRWGTTKERRPAETQGGDGGPSGMARDRCPVGLRRHRGPSRRRRRVKRYGQGPGRGVLRRGLLMGAAAEKGQAARRASDGPEGPGRSETEEPAESRADRNWRNRAYRREATKCT
jgi:hypothetical protein